MILLNDAMYELQNVRNEMGRVSGASIELNVTRATEHGMGAVFCVLQFSGQR